MNQATPSVILTSIISIIFALFLFHVSDVRSEVPLDIVTEQELTDWCIEVFELKNGTGRILEKPFNCSYQCGNHEQNDWGDIYIIEDGTTCSENGQCSTGICVPKSEFENCKSKEGWFSIRTPCIASCNNMKTLVEIHTIPLDDGSPCYRVGSENHVCQSGKCVSK